MFGNCTAKSKVSPLTESGVGGHVCDGRRSDSARGADDEMLDRNAGSCTRVMSARATVARTRCKAALREQHEKSRNKSTCLADSSDFAVDGDSEPGKRVEVDVSALSLTEAAVLSEVDRVGRMTAGGSPMSWAVEKFKVHFLESSAARAVCAWAVCGLRVASKIRRSNPKPGRGVVNAFNTPRDAMAGLSRNFVRRRMLCQRLSRWMPRNWNASSFRLVGGDAGWATWRRWGLWKPWQKRGAAFLTPSTARFAHRLRHLARPLHSPSSSVSRHHQHTRHLVGISGHLRPVPHYLQLSFLLPTILGESPRHHSPKCNSVDDGRGNWRLRASFSLTPGRISNTQTLAKNRQNSLP